MTIKSLADVPDPKNIDLKNVTKKLYPITRDKYSDLLKLCEKNHPKTSPSLLQGVAA